MSYQTRPDPADQEISGELLENSGFETEDPAAEFESDERFAEEGDLQ
jgi:hypothetical protein